jgi:MYXO-CTERM domain-containing protein
MIMNRPVISLAAAALIVCTSAGALQAQTPPPDTAPAIDRDDRDRDFDMGWLGLIGLLGLGGLAGIRRRDSVIATNPRPRP